MPDLARQFLFDIGDSVTVPEGFEGVIETGAFDAGGNLYEVRYQVHGRFDTYWFRESELT